ncbi:hypothetical protein [Nesterenkonia sp. F]|uniref:hypothetical protein n=1 Tax=Nesterenkonia sp. F TaxID=795955 RepID=UPI000255CEAB|nr:hypothetical protein [Nesterenkonia sp. F]
MSTFDTQPRRTALAVTGGLSLVVGLVLLSPAAAVATTTATPTATASPSSTPTADGSESPSTTEAGPTAQEPAREDAAATDDETAASADDSTQDSTDEATETTDSGSAETDGSKTPSGITLTCPSTDVIAGETATASISASSTVERLEVSNSVGTAGGEVSISGSTLSYTAPDPSTVDGTVAEVYTILATAQDGTTERCEATFYIAPAGSQDASDAPSAPETTDGAEEETSGAETSPTGDADAEDFLPGAGRETTSSPDGSTSGTAPSSSTTHDHDTLDASLPVPGGPQPTSDGDLEEGTDETAGAAETETSRDPAETPAPDPGAGQDGSAQPDSTQPDSTQPDSTQPDTLQGHDEGATPESQTGGGAQQDSDETSAPISPEAGDTGREISDEPVAADHASDDGLAFTGSSTSTVVALALTAIAAGAILLTVLGRRRAG